MAPIFKKFQKFSANLVRFHWVSKSDVRTDYS